MHPAGDRPSHPNLIGTNQHLQTLSTQILYKLLQLRVLGLGLFQNGDVGVGVFPEREEVLISRLCFDRAALHRVGATELEMSEYANGRVPDNTGMVWNFLKLIRGFAAPMRRQIGHSTDIDRMETESNGISGAVRTQIIWAA